MLEFLGNGSLTSNFNTDSGGIFGGWPALPYAYSGAQVNIARSPFFIVATPMSHALITEPVAKKVDCFY